MKHLLVILLLATPLAAAPRKYIVEFTDAPPAVRSARTNRFRSEAAEVALVRREFTRVFNGAAVELREGQTFEDLARLPNVAAVHPDGEVIAFASNATPMRATPQRIRTNAGGNGVVVAVIDTGVDHTHPALAGKVIGGYDFVNDDDDPMDDHRHGTHVAGIIAAQGQMTGVAPNVKLLAYKVLNNEGRGDFSDVIAAIELAVDPNGDGNPADHADIINLSLGGTGHPDDPVAQAVNNAVAAGVVVCVASGNEENFHRIGSPAGAAKAITVGASTTEEGVPILAYFTSRGPATQTAAIKPDLLAPGRDIFSTGLNHGYITLTGTSMATPYVSGLAALLLEEHPSWTPERVTAALATTASPVADEEVMAQGGGIADLARARTNTLVASPTQVAFGIDGVLAPTWSSTRHVTLRNDGAVARTLHATIEGAKPSMTVTVTPSELTLAPGESAELEVAITVDNTTLGDPATRSFSFGGVLTISGDGEPVRLPWAFVRAARASIRNLEGLANVLWFPTGEPKYASPRSLGAGGLELLLQPGSFDFVVAWLAATQLRLAFIEERHVEGDVEIVMTPESTPHEIRFEGADETGTPFPNGNGTSTMHSLLLRLILPDGDTIPLPDAATARSMRTSSFSNRFGVLVSEAFVDANAKRAYMAQYATQRGVSSNRTLAVSPGDYATQAIELHFPNSGPRRDVNIIPRDWPIRPTEHRLPPPTLRFASNTPTWTATLYMTKEVETDVVSGLQFQLFTAADPNLPATVITPMIRRREEGFTASWSMMNSLLPVWAVGGEPMSFGRSAIHIPSVLSASNEGFWGDGEVFGHRGELRRNDTSSGKIKVFNENGAQVAAGDVTPYQFTVPLPGTGKFRAELKVNPFDMDGRTGEATLTTIFDTRNGRASMPAVTSFAILDGAGRRTTHLPANGNGSLVFSAAAHDVLQYRKIASASVFFRRRGGNAWVQATPVELGEDATTDVRWPAGMVYRVDLQDALRLGPNEYEVRIEVRDDHGNWTTWQIAPAFVAEGTPGPRRRAVAK